MNHEDLLNELWRMQRLPVQERIRMAKKRRKSQVDLYNSWIAADHKKHSAPRHRKLKFSPQVRLTEAVTAGNFKELKSLMNEGINPNCMLFEGMTALHHSCIDGNLDMVNLLLKNGADVNAKDLDGWTPLHAAATCGHKEIVELLVRAEADLLVMNMEGDMPYHITDDDDTLCFLELEMLHRGITKKAIDKLHEANYQLLKKDIQRKIRNSEDIDAPVTADKASFLHVAIAHFYSNLVKLLLINGASDKVVDIDGWRPIHAAAYWGNMAAIELLVKKRNTNLSATTYNGERPYDLCEDSSCRIYILRIMNNHTIRKSSDISDTEASLADITKTKHPHLTLEDEHSNKYVSVIGSLSDNNNSSGFVQKTICNSSTAEENITNSKPIIILTTEKRNSAVKEAKKFAPLKSANSIDDVQTSDSDKQTDTSDDTAHSMPPNISRSESTKLTEPTSGKNTFQLQTDYSTKLPLTEGVVVSSSLSQDETNSVKQQIMDAISETLVNKNQSFPESNFQLDMKHSGAPEETDETPLVSLQEGIYLYYDSVQQDDNIDLSDIDGEYSNSLSASVTHKNSESVESETNAYIVKPSTSISQIVMSSMAASESLEQPDSVMEQESNMSVTKKDSDLPLEPPPIPQIVELRMQNLGTMSNTATAQKEAPYDTHSLLTVQVSTEILELTLLSDNDYLSYNKEKSVIRAKQREERESVMEKNNYVQTVGTSKDEEISGIHKQYDAVSVSKKDKKLFPLYYIWSEMINQQYENSSEKSLGPLLLDVPIKPKEEDTPTPAVQSIITASELLYDVASETKLQDISSEKKLQDVSLEPTLQDISLEPTLQDISSVPNMNEENSSELKIHEDSPIPCSLGSDEMFSESKLHNVSVQTITIADDPSDPRPQNNSLVPRSQESRQQDDLSLESIRYIANSSPKSNSGDLQGSITCALDRTNLVLEPSVSDTSKNILTSQLVLSIPETIAGAIEGEAHLQSRHCNSNPKAIKTNTPITLETENESDLCDDHNHNDTSTVNTEKQISDKTEGNEATMEESVNNVQSEMKNSVTTTGIALTLRTHTDLHDNSLCNDYNGNVSSAINHSTVSNSNDNNNSSSTRLLKITKVIRSKKPKATARPQSMVEDEPNYKNGHRVITRLSYKEPSISKAISQESLFAMKQQRIRERAGRSAITISEYQTSVKYKPQAEQTLTTSSAKLHYHYKEEDNDITVKPSVTKFKKNKICRLM